MASLSLDMNVVGFSKIELGQAFRNLEYFEIGFNLPPYGWWNEPSYPLYADCGYPCSHFEIDNVTLAPVPLPAAALSLATALAGLFALRRRVA